MSKIRQEIEWLSIKKQYKKYMEELRIAFKDDMALLKRLKLNQIRLIKKHIWSN